MEQARYLIWAKPSKPDSKPYSNVLAPPPPPLAPINSYGDSWEEQVFAEDAAGMLGGCVWPPRSYSCSFCRREFRSAQALGGHMNVHRRDRARLKQSPINIPHPPPPPAAEVAPHAVNLCTHHVFLDHASPYSSQICTNFLYNNNNPNPEVRVSSPDPPPTNNKQEIQKSTLSFFSPIFQQNHASHTTDQSPPPTWSNFVSKKRGHLVLDSIKNNVDKESAYVLTDSRAEKDVCVREDHLSVSLNLVICETKKKGLSYDIEEVASCNKRRRIEENPSSLLANLSGFDKRNLLQQSEELDLELRLGDAPKVK